MFGLGEIQNFLPGDIDLTDDEVFRDNRRWKPDRGRDLKNNPPWDSSKGSGILFSSSSSRISTWINNIVTQDRDILIDDTLFDEFVEVDSDDDLITFSDSRFFKVYVPSEFLIISPLVVNISFII